MTKKTLNAINFIETNSFFEETGIQGDNSEVLGVTDAHTAVYIGIVEALEELKLYYVQFVGSSRDERNTPMNYVSQVIIDNAINKYKKKL